MTSNDSTETESQSAKKMITVRLTEEERVLFRQAAKEMGVSLQAFCLNALKAAATYVIDVNAVQDEEVSGGSEPDAPAQPPD